MNHIYRIVWNKVTACYQAVSESATGEGKGQSKSTVVQGNRHMAQIANGRTLTATAIGAALCVLGLPSFAGPAGGRVTAGSATITQAGTATTINQTSNRAAIDWTKFSVGANESVRFNQPSASALTLNRVTGTESSAIMGSLSANGQVFILNPNGVLFGAGAQVNVGGLVASTLQMSNANFMAGNYKFAGDAAGSVVNHGHITVAPGGTLALMAPIVQNTGTLSAPGGSVLLAGAQAVTLTLQSNGGLVSYTLDAGSAQALVDNGGLIQAGGGHVVLTAKGIDALSKAVVNHSGVIEAQTVGSKNGVIELLGDMQSGTVSVSGKLDASAPNADGKGGDGGFIDTSAANVKIADTTRVTTAAAAGQTGMWLIDPTDFTINAGGGSLPPSSGIAASTLNANLSITNATIATSAAGTGNGDIFVNSAVDWSANKLTLSAHRNININANLNASGTAKLALNYGQASADGAGGDYILASGVQVNLPAGQNFSTKQGSTAAIKNYTVITTLGAEGSTTGTDLQGMNGAASGNYVLGSNIDATATSNWNAGAGFNPIDYANGYQSMPAINHIFDGLGHVISNLSINRPTQSQVGLFSKVSTDEFSFRNTGLLNANVVGLSYVGGLVGTGFSSITNSYVTGAVVGTGTYVGGLVGLLLGSINNSYATGEVRGAERVGGLVGGISQAITSPKSSVENSYFSGNVGGSKGFIGGLIGRNDGIINNSYASANVEGVGTAIFLGGLIGLNTGIINTSYATGNVSGPNRVGGLVGLNNSGGTINNSYATGAVHAGTVIENVYYVGGLASSNSGTISNSYASGAVSVSVSGRSVAAAGGLIGGVPQGTNANSYWNIQTSGQSSSAGGTGKTTAEMQQQPTYAGWDFVNTWRIVEGSSYPMLRALTQGKITLSAPARDIEKVYDKTAWAGGIIDYSGFTAGDTSGALQGTLKWVGTAEGAVNAGNYTLVPTGLFSQKYEVVYLPGTLTIQPRPVDVAVAKTYDGNATFASGFVASNGVLTGDTVSLSGSATVNSANAGSYSTFSSNNLVSSNSNYTANPQYVYTGVLGKVAATIDPAALTLLGITGSRVYDGTTNANWDDNTKLQGVLAADAGNVALASGVGTLDSKDAGTRQLTSAGSLQLGGSAAQNYTLTTNGSQWTVTPRTVDVSVVKVYNGNATFTNSFVASNGVLAGDTVNLSGAASVSSANAGSYSAFSSNSLVSSNPNYTANPQAGTSGRVLATIDPAALSLLGVIGSRVYDGTTSANWNDNILFEGVLSADLGRVAIVAGAGTLDSKNVGTRQLTSAGSLKLGGDAAQNYVINPAGSKWVISPAELSLWAVTQKKAYDGTIKSTEMIGVEGLKKGDSVEGVQEYSSKNAGSNLIKLVRYTINDGNNGKNYNVTVDDVSVGTIVPRLIRVYGANIEDKSFDGTDSATVNGAKIDKLSGDDLYINSEANFVNSYVENGKTVPVWWKLAGNDRKNYELLIDREYLKGNILPPANLMDNINYQLSLAQQAIISSDILRRNYLAVENIFISNFNAIAEAGGDVRLSYQQWSEARAEHSSENGWLFTLSSIGTTTADYGTAGGEMAYSIASTVLEMASGATSAKAAWHTAIEENGKVLGESDATIANWKNNSDTVIDLVGILKSARDLYGDLGGVMTNFQLDAIAAKSPAAKKLIESGQIFLTKDGAVKMSSKLGGLMKSAAKSEGFLNILNMADLSKDVILLINDSISSVD